MSEKPQTYILTDIVTLESLVAQVRHLTSDQSILLMVLIGQFDAHGHLLPDRTTAAAMNWKLGKLRRVRKELIAKNLVAVEGSRP